MASDIRSHHVARILGEIDKANADLKDLEANRLFGNPDYVMYFGERVGRLEGQVNSLYLITRWISQMNALELGAARIVACWYRQAHVEGLPPLPIATSDRNACAAFMVTWNVLVSQSDWEHNIPSLANLAHGMAHLIIAHKAEILKGAPLALGSLEPEPWVPLQEAPETDHLGWKPSGRGPYDPSDFYIPLPPSYAAVSGELYTDAVAGYIAGPTYVMEMLFFENRIGRLLFHPAVMHAHMAAVSARLAADRVLEPVAQGLLDAIEQQLSRSRPDWSPLLEAPARLMVQRCTAAGMVPWSAQKAQRGQPPIVELINQASYRLVTGKSRPFAEKRARQALRQIRIE